jgi:four helix bundle protein
VGLWCRGWSQFGGVGRGWLAVREEGSSAGGMPKYQRFEEVPAWQAGAKLYNLVLDLFRMRGDLFTSGYRNQLDRAALSVSNNIAEGFDRQTTGELSLFLGYARGSASEVKSMILVVLRREELRSVAGLLGEIERTAESCSRQLTAWSVQVASGPVQGKRQLTGEARRSRQAEDARQGLRSQFLLSLPSEHPLYASPEAKAARKAAGLGDGDG